MIRVFKDRNRDSARQCPQQVDGGSDLIRRKDRSQSVSKETAYLALHDIEEMVDARLITKRVQSYAPRLSLPILLGQGQQPAEQDVELFGGVMASIERLELLVVARDQVIDDRLEKVRAVGDEMRHQRDRSIQLLGETAQSERADSSPREDSHSGVDDLRQTCTWIDYAWHAPIMPRLRNLSARRQRKRVLT